jgi:regulatory protein
MAQSWRVEPERNKKPRPPLDEAALERLAIHYVGRYATTRAKLKTYLSRKLKERGWEGPARPDVERLAERLSRLGYIDDEAFAAARASSLQRRGYGERRVVQSLRAAGIEEEDAAAVRGQVEEGARDAAFRFARRKRIGPFAPREMDRDARQKAFAAMMRAGHPMEIVREVLNASPADIPDMDSI